ncbi:MAG: carbohydrate binding domain-containing protein, partial [Planctomycetaceae bacterium]|nr:carbohydrate binding domain-containing protein [Planctomycetaceae bacterium]
MKKSICFTAFVCTLTLYFVSTAAADNELFPFVISFDAPKNITNISHQLDVPAGKHGFVRVQDGHFVTDKGRIQFWGTNTCFAANFLDHAAADRMADRLARFGINCVRLHHMDSHDIWGGSNAKTKLEFDKAQLDKLDYYIAALKKRGIYVNINLHVSRSLDERDGFPKNVNRPNHDKGIDNYYRPFIDANKKYARDLLTHVNPYTGNAYKDEPSVAMIEINNENSIVCMWGGWGGLDVIQDPFLGDLRKLWNDWLKTKYKNDTELRKAWNCRSVPSGEELLKKAGFDNGYIPDGKGWNWETDAVADAAAANNNGILQLDVRKKGNVDWHPQLIASGFAVKKDQLYTLEVKVKANQTATLNVGLRMNHEPWEGLGFDSRINLTTDWQTIKFVTTPPTDDPNARISIGGLSAGTVYEIDYVSFKPGGEIGLPKDTSLAAGSVPVIWKKDTGNYTKEAVNDFCDFLFDIEAKYWDEMYRFLKDEIKVKQPVSGTQLEYGSAHAQAKMDYCDIHAYWNHPHFPGKAWDGNNWYLRNIALVNHLDKQILPNLATKRVYGKPFTVSEYNHPYPNQYAAEGLPLLAAFGAFQGWDGIFPFAYSHSNNPEPKKATSFFDTAGNTVQTAHMIACHALFCDGFNWDANKDCIVAPLTAEKEREIFKQDRHQYRLGFSGLGLDIRNALTNPVAVDVSGKIKELPKLPEIPKE